MTIRALRNFGHKGENVPAGAVLEVDPEEFGGTFETFRDEGWLEVFEAPAAEVSGAGAEGAPAVQVASKKAPAAKAAVAPEEAA